MFIEYLNQNTEKLQEFIDFVFADKKNKPEYVYNYDIATLFNRHVLGGKLCLSFIDDEIILTDFSISVNGDTQFYHKNWIKFLKSIYGKDFKNAYKTHQKVTNTNNYPFQILKEEHEFDMFEKDAIL